MVVGVDEVGRGPWAGPLVVGAVLLSPTVPLDGLTDSKKLSGKRRTILDVSIRENALGYGLGWVHVHELDAVGLSAALQLATVRALKAITVPYDEIIIDGTVNFLKGTPYEQRVSTLAKADALIPAVSAASIIAKVARDTYMHQQDAVYPDYGFATHVGYGTAKHIQALHEYGVTPIHRRSFAPIARLLNNGSTKSAGSTTARRSLLTTKAIGDTAEEIVSRRLVEKGFRIIERNWRTRYCEIDIIADTPTTRYFIEVKYRRSAQQGGGIGAITEQKRKHMRFAAELYTARHPSAKLLTLAVVAFEDIHNMTLLKVE